MSRLNPGENNFLPNPCSKFLNFKNIYTKEIVKIKGKEKEIKVFDSCGFEWGEKDADDKWVSHEVRLPIKFAILDKDWVNFKGYCDADKTMYWSNEVKTATDVINIRNKDKTVYSFTLNELWGKTPGSKVKDEAKSKAVKAKLTALGVKQHSSIYIALVNERGEFEMANLQLKGANLSGSKDVSPSGWWNVQKDFSKFNKIYTHFLEINNFIVESGELGEYGILNYELGDVISAEDTEVINDLARQLETYHVEYSKKAEVSTPEPVTAMEHSDLPFDEE